MEGFDIEKIDLSLADPNTGVQMTANVYRVDGIERQLSIGELVMAICLARATELEATIIGQMEKMARTTNNLDVLTASIARLVELQDDNAERKVTSLDDGDFNIGTIYWYDDSGSQQSYDLISVGALKNFLVSVVGIDEINKVWQDAKISEVVSLISTKMDSLNSVSQKQTIELQSMTNKRDQSYDLITNMLKSMNTVLNSMANNIAR